MKGITISVAVATVLLCGFSASAQEGDGEPAAALFQEGVARFGQGDFAGALESFTASYEARPNPALRFNVGVCHFNLRHWIQARRELSQYLVEIDPSLTTDGRRRQVEALLAQVDPHVGLLDVEVSEQEATVSVDSTEFGTSPLAAPVALEPGVHQLEVSLEGREPFTRTIEVSAGQRTALNVVLVLIPEPPPAPVVAPPEPEPVFTPAMPVEPPTPQRRRLSRAWFGITTGLALSLALAGTITGGLTRAGASDFESEIDGCVENNNRECPGAYTLRDEIEGLASATTGLFISAGALALAAFVLAFFTNWSGDHVEEPNLSVGLAPLADNEGGLSGVLLDTSVRF